MRRAEMQVYDQLAASRLRGQALYEVRATHQSRELDFLIFLEEKARMAVEVKGGLHRMIDGCWELRTPGGWQPKRDPFARLTEATDALRELLHQRVGRRTFMLKVLMFPDMEPDSEIQDHAVASGVHVIWGAEPFVERLLELAGPCGTQYPPTATDIEEETFAITGGWPAPAPWYLRTDTVVIQRAEVVNIHVAAMFRDEANCSDCG